MIVGNHHVKTLGVTVLDTSTGKPNSSSVQERLSQLPLV